MKKEYLKIPLQIILDPNLTLEAIGLWAWAMAQDDSVLNLQYIQLFTPSNINCDNNSLKDHLKLLIDGGYCIINEHKDNFQNDYIFLEKKVSPSILDILIKYKIRQSHIQAILMYEPEEITVAIEAVQQWANKKESEGKPLVDYGLAIIKALINKWRPSPQHGNKNSNSNTKP